MSLIRVLLIAAALVVTTATAASAQTPPALPMNAAEQALQSGFVLIEKNRTEQVAYCRADNKNCLREFEQARKSALALIAVAIEYRLAESNSDISKMKELRPKHVEAQQNWEANSRNLDKYIKPKVGSLR